MSWKGRVSSCRLFSVFLLLLCIYALDIVKTQLNYEKYLNSLSITFDDFPQDYSQALIDAHVEDRQIQYDNYSTSFPSLDSYATTPPIIHFIWFKDLYDTHLDVSKIPTSGSQAPEICQDNNPSFTINVWNASSARSLIAEHYEWFLDTYDGYEHPIQRVDAFKYFVIFHFGGIYMDLDIDCRRSLYPLLQFPAWFPKTALLGINNDAFAARRQHPVIGEMTRRLESRDVDLLFPYLTIYWSTGPQFASDALKSWWYDHRDEGSSSSLGTEGDGAGSDEFYVLPLDFYSEKYSFFGHSPGGTWHGWDVGVALFLVAHLWIIVLIVGSPFACGLIVWMKRRLGRRHVNYAKVSGA